MSLIREQEAIKTQISSSIPVTPTKITEKKASFNAQLEELLPGEQKDGGLNSTIASSVKVSPNKEDSFKTEITPKKEDNTLENKRAELDRQIKELQGKIVTAKQQNDLVNERKYTLQLKPLLIERQNLECPSLPAEAKSTGVMLDVAGQDILSLPARSSPIMLLAGWNNNEKPLKTFTYQRFVDFSQHVVPLGTHNSLPVTIDLNEGIPNRQGTVAKQIPSLSSPTRRQAETIIKGAVENSAKKFNLTQEEQEKLEKYSKAIAVQESGMNVNVKDGDNGDSYGMFQINSPAHPDYDVGRGRKDPKYNAQYGVDFLASLYKKNGSWEKAVERYNGSGPMAVAYRNSVVKTAAKMSDTQAQTV